MSVSGSPAPRVTRRRSQTRARLLDAAFAVFAARGFGHASIEEICEAAGFSRGAFYSNFSTLEELFFALYEQRSSVITEQVRALLATVEPDSSVRTLAERVTDALLVDRNWLLVKTEFLLHAARHPDLAASLISQRERIRHALTEPLGEAVDPAGLPPALRDVGNLARAVADVHDGAMLQLLLDHDTEAVRQWLTDLLVALLDHRPGPD